MKHLPFVVSTAGLLFAAGCGGDTVQVSGGDGSEDGVLLDGTAAGNPHIYDRATGADGAAIAVGPYDASPGEVIAYTVGHAPAINTPTAWTSSDDNITFGFGPKYRVRFQNWIVQGPFATGQTRAVNACIRTSQIWRDERQGTSFSVFGITDATADPQAANYTAFTCAAAAGIKTDIGFDANAVNVYWVNTVDFGSGPGTGNGVWCSGNNVIAMGANVLDHLFSHEIGHAFSLQHVNTLGAFFDETNVMHNASNFRAYLTEGQTVRATFDPASVVNTLAGRVGVTRACGNATSVTDPQCPAVQKRIWGDGAPWPPN